MPLYILKSRELLDGSGRAIYLVLTETGEQDGRLTCEPQAAKDYAARHDLQWISPAKFYSLAVAA